MLPALAAIVEALFYLLCVPVNLALMVDDGAGLRLGAGISLFEPRFARQRALRKLASPKEQTAGPGPKRTLRTLRRMKFQRLEIAGTLSLGDAAATALLCGAVNGAACALRPRARRFRADVRPDFSADFRVHLRGMLSARAGQIIFAAIFR